MTDLYEEYNKVDEFDIDMANRLLNKIRLINNFAEIRVPNPKTDGLESFNLKEWKKWYIKYTYYYGSNGAEKNVLSVLDIIEKELNIIQIDIEEGYRKILTVSERRGILNKALIDKLKEKDAKIEELQDTLNEAKIPIKSEPVVEPKEEETVKETTETEPELEETDMFSKNRKPFVYVPKEKPKHIYKAKA